MLFRIKEMTSLPTFLPNPSRVLLASFDAWASKSTDSSRDKMIALNALMRALKEAGSAASPRVESIPYLIATEDPPHEMVQLLAGLGPSFGGATSLSRVRCVRREPYHFLKAYAAGGPAPHSNSARDAHAPSGALRGGRAARRI